MKPIEMAFVGCLAWMVAVAAHGESVCAPPLPQNCVQPNWGMIDPVDGDDALAAPRDGGALMAARPAVARIRLIATDVQKPQPVASATTPKLIVDDGQRFAPETNALIAAILRASFTKDGQIEKGADEIRATAERLQKVSSGHQLNLYVRSGKRLRPDVTKSLSKKVASVNDLLVAPTTGR